MLSGKGEKAIWKNSNLVFIWKEWTLFSGRWGGGVTTCLCIRTAVTGNNTLLWWMGLRTKAQEPLPNSSSAEAFTWGQKPRHICICTKTSLEPWSLLCQQLQPTSEVQALAKRLHKTSITLTLARRSTTPCYRATTKVKQLQKTLTTLGSIDKSLWLWAVLKHSSTSKLGRKESFSNSESQ